MGVKNDDELTKHIKNVMKIAMLKTRNDIYNIITGFMSQYYHEYTPKEYERTYRFFNSLVKSKIFQSDGEFAYLVYIDTDRMNKYVYNTGEEVADMINRGFHADTGMNTRSGYETDHNIRGTAVWNESISEIEKTNIILNTFEEYFKKYAK